MARHSLVDPLRISAAIASMASQNLFNSLPDDSDSVGSIIRGAGDRKGHGGGMEAEINQALGNIFIADAACFRLSPRISIIHSWATRLSRPEYNTGKYGQGEWRYNWQIKWAGYYPAAALHCPSF